MLAGAHWVLRIVTGRQRASEQARTLGELPGMRRRRAWALSVQQTLDAVSHCQPPWWQLPHPYRDFPPLLRREVVWACRPALLAVVGALGDERQPTVVRRRPCHGPPRGSAASAQLHRPPGTVTSTAMTVGQGGVVPGSRGICLPLKTGARSCVRSGSASARISSPARSMVEPRTGTS